MIIWLIATGEPLPIQSNDNRLHRMGLLANELNKKGHCVVWWTSTLNHFSKKYYFKNNSTCTLNDNYEIKLLHSVVYNKNISISRVINHIGIAIQFWRQSKRSLKPSLILCSFPTLEFSYVAIRYGKKNKVPVILDARDMWPDIFLEVAPRRFRQVIKLILTPYYFLTKKVFREATNIFAVNEEYLKWGLDKAERIIKKNDLVFPLAYPQLKYSNVEVEKSNEKWRESGVSDDKFIIVYIGAMAENKIDFDTVLNAAKDINLKFKDEILFVFCGLGDDLKLFQNKSKDVSNIILPGWVNGPEIFSLLSISAIGLCPYKNRFDYIVSVPNKPIEYMSFGLPIITSLRGSLEKLIEEEKIGFHYSNSQKLIDCILKLKEDKCLYDNISKNSLKLYEEKFTADLVYCNYASSIISIAGGS